MKKKLAQIFIVSLSMSLLLASCLYGIKGSGKVVRTERQVGSFEAISVSAGLEVILLQDSVVKVVVEADDNLQEVIKTEVSNGELKIYPERRIGSCSSKKITVTFKTIHSLEGSSGSEIQSRMELKMPSLRVSGSSGANIDLTFAVTELTVSGSSGVNMKISGSAQNMEIDGSSGANIKAVELKTLNCTADASSGANLKITVTDKISARASSGGSIKVEGSPKNKNVEKSSGGDVSFD